MWPLVDEVKPLPAKVPTLSLNQCQEAGSGYTSVWRIDPFIRKMRALRSGLQGGSSQRTSRSGIGRVRKAPLHLLATLPPLLLLALIQDGGNFALEAFAIRLGRSENASQLGIVRLNDHFDLSRLIRVQRQLALQTRNDSLRAGRTEGRNIRYSITVTVTPTPTRRRRRRSGRGARTAWETADLRASDRFGRVFLNRGCAAHCIVK